MNLSIIYRQFGEIYRLGVPQRRASARLGRTNSSAESTDNRPMFREKRPILDAKSHSLNLSTCLRRERRGRQVIYHHFSGIYRSEPPVSPFGNLPAIYRRAKRIYRWRLSPCTPHVSEYPQPIRNRTGVYSHQDIRQEALLPKTKWGRAPTIEGKAGTDRLSRHNPRRRGHFCTIGRQKKGIGNVRRTDIHHGIGSQTPQTPHEGLKWPTREWGRNGDMYQPLLLIQNPLAPVSTFMLVMICPRMPLFAGLCGYFSGR